MGEHELEITDDGLIERTAYNESKYVWEMIESIESSPNHTFIRIGPNLAHTVPHRKIIDGNLREFLAGIEERLRPGEVLHHTEV